MGKQVLKKFIKDIFKGLPGSILEQFQKNEINEAVGKAIKEFLVIFQYKLLYNCFLHKTEVKEYSQSSKKFLDIDGVEIILVTTLHLENNSINIEELEKIWYDKKLLQVKCFD